jgi:hypothetical protein
VAKSPWQNRREIFDAFLRALSKKGRKERLHNLHYTILIQIERVCKRFRLKNEEKFDKFQKNTYYI